MEVVKKPGDYSAWRLATEEPTPKWVLEALGQANRTELEWISYTYFNKVLFLNHRTYLPDQWLVRDNTTGKVVILDHIDFDRQFEQNKNNEV